MLRTPGWLVCVGGFIQQLGRIRADARWPIRNATKIRDEVERITLDFMVAAGRWGAGTAGPPRLGPILGNELPGLMFRHSASSLSHVDDALRREAYRQ
jgi:hypothetical protein